MNHKYKKFIELMVLSIMFSACEGIGTPTPTPAPGITPCASGSNPYVTSINPNLNAIYEMGVESAGNSSEYDNVQLQALNELVNHVYHLSDSVEFLSGGKTIRITITYVSPELAHIVVVNHYLSKRYLHFSGKLNEQVQSHLGRMIGRNEYVFFITFSASVYIDDPTSIFVFPLKQLKLTNTNSISIIPAHGDHVLKKPIDLTDGPKYGFFYYPMAIIQNGPCKIVLDNYYDTNIELNIPKLVINDENIGPQFWDYKIAPLIDMTNVSGSHQNRFSLSLIPDQFSPKTSMLTAMDIESPDFWTGLARIIWLEITQDP